MTNPSSVAIAGRTARCLTVFACLAAMFATNSVRATSYVYKPLALPRTDEVAAFANGVEEPVTRKLVPRETILKFLAKGKNNTQVETWYQLEHRHDNGEFVADGVFTDKAGKVYFWTLCDRKVLKIISADHEQALVQL